MEREFKISRILDKIDTGLFVPVFQLDPLPTHSIVWMEYMPEGSLEDYIKNNNPVDLKLFVKIAVSVARSLHLAHQMKILHLDIHLGNIFLTNKIGNREAEIVVGDLGQAVDMQTNDWACSNIWHPSILSLKDEIMNGGISHKIDVYCYGKILEKLLQVLCEKNRDIITSFQYLIQNCTTKEVSCRWNIEQVLAYIFKDFNSLVHALYMRDFGLLEQATKDNLPKKDMNYALKLAALLGCDKMVAFLLKDERVNPSVDSNCALLRAIACGSEKTVSVLLRSKCVQQDLWNNRYQLDEVEKVANLRQHVGIIQRIKEWRTQINEK